VIPPVAVGLARVPFLLDVVHLPVRGELAVSADDASAVESCESEESNETSHTASAHRKSNIRTCGSRLLVLYGDNVRRGRIEHFLTLWTKPQVTMPLAIDVSAIAR
jgi:hypothetical protein